MVLMVYQVDIIKLDSIVVATRLKYWLKNWTTKNVKTRNFPKVNLVLRLDNGSDSELVPSLDYFKSCISTLWRIKSFSKLLKLFWRLELKNWFLDKGSLKAAKLKRVLNKFLAYICADYSRTAGAATWTCEGKKSKYIKRVVLEVFLYWNESSN